MKKSVLGIVGLFVLGIVMNFNMEQESVSFSESAFADKCCKDEEESVCGLDGKNYDDKYLHDDDEDNFSFSIL